MTASALSTGSPSASSTQILNQLDLFRLYGRDPDAAILALRKAMLAQVDRAPMLFALAELEFHRGEQPRRSDPRPHFLASAVYRSEEHTSELQSP